MSLKAQAGQECAQRSAQVVHVEVGERARAGGIAIAVRERTQLFQALGDRRREAVLARHVRVQDDVCGVPGRVGVSHLLTKKKYDLVSCKVSMRRIVV